MTVAEGGADGGRGAAHTVARSQQVARWLVEGLSTAEVHQLARETWAVSHRTADRLVAAGRAELVRVWHVERTEMLALSLARLDSVFAAAVAAKNFNAALGCINAQAKLAQLDSVVLVKPDRPMSAPGNHRWPPHPADAQHRDPGPLAGCPAGR
jgi:hypothetical protein